MFNFKRTFNQFDFFVPEEIKNGFKGGWGYVMAVNYHDSPVGPYKELLVIPGKFQTPGGNKQTISKIYVDSQASMNSGRQNWGIPKELANISWGRADGTLKVRAEKEGNCFFEMQVKNRPLKFPLTTALLPIRLYQLLNHKTYKVNPSGRGIGQWAKASIQKINPGYFPDVSKISCLAISVRPFWMKFP